jgi:hypothetical protein
MSRHSNPPGFRSDQWLTMLLLLPTSALLAQPFLRITSPPDRTVVHPGETPKVIVETPAQLNFEWVSLITTVAIQRRYRFEGGAVRA